MKYSKNVMIWMVLVLLGVLLLSTVSSSLLPIWSENFQDENTPDDIPSDSVPEQQPNADPQQEVPSSNKKEKPAPELEQNQIQE